MPAKTILVIEDDAAQRALLGDLLEDAGFRVLSAGDGADALAHLAEPVDLILLDLVMPRARLDGFAFLSEMRARPECADTPIVILSGLGDVLGDTIDPTVAERLRIVAVVAKPFDTDELTDRIRAILGAGKPSNERRAR